MSRLNFSLSDYQDHLQEGRHQPPEAFCPYFEMDPLLYGKLREAEKKNRRRNIKAAWEELQRRTDRTYFRKTYPLQSRSLDYSARAFPAYRFILPEVMTEDWLAIVDWGKFQRDHVLHQPLCGYIALGLLPANPKRSTLALPSGKTILDTCVKQILRWKETAYIREFLHASGMAENDPLLDENNPVAQEVWRTFFREAVYVAALFHDLGYPWQYAEGVQGNLDGINAPALRQNRSAQEVVELFGSRLMFCALQGYEFPRPTCPSTWKERVVKMTDLALTQTHGFPGALGFLHLNDCIRRYPCRKASPMHLLCIEWVATAIMMHDMCKIYWGQGAREGLSPDNSFLRLSSSVDPLSALVTLIDIIQDFERPIAVFGRDRVGDGVTLAFEAPCLGTDVELDNGTLTITYRMKTAEDVALKRFYLDKERYNLFDPRNGYLDLSSWGITDVSMLASLATVPSTAAIPAHP